MGRPMEGRRRERKHGDECTGMCVWKEYGPFGSDGDRDEGAYIGTGDDLYTFLVIISFFHFFFYSFKA
jgi:hypothetical protein